MWFYGSVFDSVLYDALFLANNQYMSQIFYSQIAVATVIYMAHHLVKQIKDTNNGYSAWKQMYEDYDRDVINN